MRKPRKVDWEAVAGLAFLILVFAMIVGAIAIGVQNESKRITEGIIVDKQFFAEQSYYSGTKDSSTYHHSPERHLFLLRGEKNGKTVEYWCEVSAEDYDRYRTGEYYRK